MRILTSLLLCALLMSPANAQVEGCSADVCPVLLELDSIEVDPSDGTWEAAEGKVVETTPEGNVGTFTWTTPPQTITIRGFEMELTIEGKAAQDQMYPLIIYVDGAFSFRPDPPQAHLYLNSDSGTETLKVTVKPTSSQLAGGLYTLHVGAAYGKAVHYIYRTVPQFIQ
jgi:hypothetical protein